MEKNYEKANEHKRFWQGFWQLADIKIWIASTVPLAVAFAMSYPQTDAASVFWFALSVIGVYLIEIGKNGANEVVDFLSGVDRNIPATHQTPFSGGKKTIVQGKLTVYETILITVACYTLAAVIGLVIVIWREFNVLWVGIAGLALSLFYSIPPFKLCYRGVGEITVGITFGPLIMMGTQLVMLHSIDTRILLASIPIGLFIANVLWINQYPDYEVDKAGNKRNWVVRLGKEKGVTVFGLLFALGYAMYPLLAVVNRNPMWVLPLITVPLAVQAVQNARKHANHLPQLLISNAKTVQIYQLVGLTMILASITDSFIRI